MCFEPPPVEECDFDFATSFGFDVNAFSDEIKGCMDAENNMYIFQSFGEDIASPNAVTKPHAKKLLEEIAFGSTAQ